MRRGEVFTHPSAPHRLLALASADQLTHAGTAIMVELVGSVPGGLRGLVSVVADADSDGVTGVLRADRIGYYATARLGEPVGALSPGTMELVDMALRTALDLN